MTEQSPALTPTCPHCGHQMTIDEMADPIKQALEAPKSVLRDPDGSIFIEGSGEDRVIIGRGLAALEGLEKAEPVAQELAMLVRQLVSHLRRVAPEDELADRALDYLRRKDLLGSVLRQSSAQDVSHAAWVSAIEAAAKWVEKRSDDYDADHGTTDPETGAREYPGNGVEYVGELAEIAEGIRALACTHPAPVQAEPGWRMVPETMVLDEESTAFIHGLTLPDEDREHSEIRLLVGDGHSGHGLYACLDEYPEEGAELICQFAAAPQPAADHFPDTRKMANEAGAQVVGLTDAQIQRIGDGISTFSGDFHTAVACAGIAEFCRVNGIKPPEKGGA